MQDLECDNAQSSGTECLQDITQIGLSLKEDICGWDPEYSAIAKEHLSREKSPEKDCVI